MCNTIVGARAATRYGSGSASAAGAVIISGHQYMFQFLLEDICFPIHGRDFLCHFQLVVHVCADRLLPGTALAQLVGSNSSPLHQ
jgi:hypothetical protein